MVTDYDCWRSDGDDVDITQILAQLQANAATAQRLIVELAKALPGERPPSPIDTVLDTALITPPDARGATLMAKLDAVCRTVLARPAGEKPRAHRWPGTPPHYSPRHPAIRADPIPPHIPPLRPPRVTPAAPT